MHGTPHTVADVMTHTVVALVRDTVFKDIVKAMGRWHVSALPVVDGDHRVLGVVSEADLLPKEEFREGDPDRYARLRRLSDLSKAGARTAEDLMTAPAVTVRADATLAQAARAMARGKVKRLPVVDADGVLEGIVSRSDLLKVFLRDDEDIAGEVRDQVVAFLFPDPVEPIRVTVRDGVVALTGRVRDTSIVPVAARLVRAVEGVVDVDCALLGPPRRPDLDPDLPGATPAGGADRDLPAPSDSHR
ncbi:CBS domain-containing protein [Streptomyces sp. SAI-208]|uniref:CBS domain-containing protein n=1 Tax=unclassified Streptomyces TaxID=2593676 RepID=UPI0024743C7F|nr:MULTISPECIES: CBS domain-containing protein [unclassified Streptomyces]MDH6514819.1 CBS domain-containing protein [Streptomyces sp. SAI-090]MDH6566114.1 CBS domain-containing protein [Streptomyces sp. SAI-117]MDH6588979.1 CBS domain-containing protein [Streptomyces sp. SAI-133]MDH6605666.1 CBS domain-containing protein [Streptomyces sp. SAI-208]MDH6621099.1 CBS domain-containing protein [Streptomyces sp. SAI-135]